MKLKGIELLGTYKVKYFSDCFRVYDSNGNLVYYEESNGYWVKREYDSNGNLVYFEDSDGYWLKREYDSNNNEVYYEKSNGYWFKREYDSNNNEVYFEDSDGLIVDRRKENEMTLEEICKELGRDIKIIKKEKL